MQKVYIIAEILRNGRHQSCVSTGSRNFAHVVVSWTCLLACKNMSAFMLIPIALENKETRMDNQNFVQVRKGAGRLRCSRGEAAHQEPPYRKFSKCQPHGTLYCSKLRCCLNRCSNALLKARILRGEGNSSPVERQPRPWQVPIACVDDTGTGTWWRSASVVECGSEV